MSQLRRVPYVPLRLNKSEMPANTTPNGGASDDMDSQERTVPNSEAHKTWAELREDAQKARSARVNAAMRCLEELLAVHKIIEDQQNNEMQQAVELLTALVTEHYQLRKECEENAKTLEASEHARKTAEAQVETLNRVQEKQKGSCVQVQELRARANIALKTVAEAAEAEAVEAAKAALAKWNDAAEQLCTVPSVLT